MTNQQKILRTVRGFYNWTKYHKSGRKDANDDFFAIPLQRSVGCVWEKCIKPIAQLINRKNVNLIPFLFFSRFTIIRGPQLNRCCKEKQ